MADKHLILIDTPTRPLQKEWLDSFAATLQKNKGIFISTRPQVDLEAVDMVLTIQDDLFSIERQDALTTLFQTLCRQKVILTLGSLAKRQNPSVAIPLDQERAVIKPVLALSKMMDFSTAAAILETQLHRDRINTVAPKYFRPFYS